MDVRLGANRYGKAECRVVRVVRDAGTHHLHDLTVSVALAGDLAATHLHGDNAAVLPTDSQKNTVYAFAADGIGEIEQYGLRLAHHFVDTQASIVWARVSIMEHPWQRLGPHSFQRTGTGTRVAVVTVAGRHAWVVSGVSDLVLLNTTDSAFVGFVRDPYTTLPEAEDRILATAVTARWRHAQPSSPDWAAAHVATRDLLVRSFVDTYSWALQQTLFAMGQRVLEHRPELVEVRLSLPNRHHVAVDLAPFGRDNANEVFRAEDRPYGLIQGVVHRDGVPPADEAWEDPWSF
jgi:urate oxidase